MGMKVITAAVLASLKIGFNKAFTDGFGFCFVFYGLFHRNALGQIAGFVYIQALGYADVIGQ